MRIVSFLFFAVLAVGGAQADDLTLRVAGEAEVVVNADGRHCPGVDETKQNTDIPDAPLRLIRLGTDELLGFAPHYNNYLYTGRSADRLWRKDCKTVFDSARNPDPSKMAALEWLVAPYLLGDGTIYSLVHNEYQGARYDEQCRKRLPDGAPPWGAICIYASLTAAVSTDKGLSFQRVAGPLQLVAAPPSKFRSDSRWYGVHDPSNIVKSPVDGYYYFTANSPQFAEMENGICVFRTKNPLLEPWLAWDGNGFRLRMKSPYDQGAASGKSCKSVLSHAISGITFNTELGRYIGVGVEEKDRVYYSTSKDLVNWEPVRTLLEASPPFAWKDRSKPPVNFLSLIDPASKSANFDISGRNLYLYFVRWRLKPDGGVQSRVRDIVRIPLSVSK